jgi:hypothetical protein
MHDLTPEIAGLTGLCVRVTGTADNAILHAFETGSQARDGIGRRLACYNAGRPHSTHGIWTPNEVHASKTEPMRMAA